MNDLPSQFKVEKLILFKAGLSKTNGAAPVGPSLVEFIIPVVIVGGSLNIPARSERLLGWQPNLAHLGPRVVRKLCTYCQV